MIQPTRLITCLGLVAGSLAITHVAHADIPITGGQVTGEAAFFTQTNVPTTAAPTLTRTGQPVLFDTVIQTLRIVTPNGTTTTSRFLPNAARFTDVNGNSRPDSGDTGRLEGALSGVAFNRLGSPVFFQNIPTALNFTLSSFTPVFTDPGSLINPRQEGTAPLLFLPGVNVRLSPASNTTFNSRFGLLETGAFAGNLTGDFIGLPSDLQLRPATGDVTLVPVVLGRRVKFDFEGKNARVDEAAFGVNPDTARRELNFAGTVTDFQIQSVGTPGTREFQVKGSGSLDITLTGPFDIKKDSLNLNGLTTGQTVDYQIKGEGPGFVAFTGANSVAFSGTSRRETQFKFERGDRTFEGRSDGDVSFVVNDRRDNIDFNSPNFSFTVPVVNVGVTTTTTGAPFVSTPPLTGGVGVTGSTTTTTTTSSFVFTTTVFNTNSITIFPGYRNLLIERDGDDDDDDDDDDDRTSAAGRNGDDDDDDRTSATGRDGDDDDDDDDDDDNEGFGRNVVYYVYAPQRQATEVVIERRGDRILVVDRTPVRGRKLRKRGQVVSAYQVVGLPSRVFPGMTGLRQIPPEQVPAASVDESDAETAEGLEGEDNQAAIAPTQVSEALPVANTSVTTAPTSGNAAANSTISPTSGTNSTP
ncbi:MAG: hypothetical protein NW220_20130 [Leptolyngbyaceae cyanobacterium bins.349]|nr:hypothetical protein [Leptolyngbyaceae cyanobacterium bins.349]